MKTLTITEAKKNLGRWLNAAGRGEAIGIISGTRILALKPVEVQAKNWWDDMPVDAEYLRTEYGVMPKQAEKAFARWHKRIEKDRLEGKLISVPENLEEALEKIAGLTPPRAKAAARATRQRGKRRGVRVA